LRRVALRTETMNARRDICPRRFHTAFIARLRVESVFRCHSRNGRSNGINHILLVFRNKTVCGSACWKIRLLYRNTFFYALKRKVENFTLCRDNHVLCYLKYTYTRRIFRYILSQNLLLSNFIMFGDKLGQFGNLLILSVTIGIFKI